MGNGISHDNHFTVFSGCNISEAQSKQDPYWLFNREVQVSAPEFIAEIKNRNNSYIKYDLYRVVDWQTGKVIYITINQDRYDTSPTIAVESLEHAGVPSRH